MKKKIISIFLSASMIVSVLPQIATAEWLNYDAEGTENRKTVVVRTTPSADEEEPPTVEYVMRAYESGDEEKKGEDVENEEGGYTDSIESVYYDNNAYETNENDTRASVKFRILGTTTGTVIDETEDEVATYNSGFTWSPGDIVWVGVSIENLAGATWNESGLSGLNTIGTAFLYDANFLTPLNYENWETDYDETDGKELFWANPSDMTNGYLSYFAEKTSLNVQEGMESKYTYSSYGDTPMSYSYLDDFSEATDESGNVVNSRIHPAYAPTNVLIDTDTPDLYVADLAVAAESEENVCFTTADDKEYLIGALAFVMNDAKTAEEVADKKLIQGFMYSATTMTYIHSIPGYDTVNYSKYTPFGEDEINDEVKIAAPNWMSTLFNIVNPELADLDTYYNIKYYAKNEMEDSDHTKRLSSLKFSAPNQDWDSNKDYELANVDYNTLREEAVTKPTLKYSGKNADTYTVEGEDPAKEYYYEVSHYIKEIPAGRKFVGWFTGDGHPATATEAEADENLEEGDPVWGMELKAGMTGEKLINADAYDGNTDGEITVYARYAPLTFVVTYHGFDKTFGEAPDTTTVKQYFVYNVDDTTKPIENTDPVEYEQKSVTEITYPDSTHAVEADVLAEGTVTAGMMRLPVSQVTAAEGLIKDDASENYTIPEGYIFDGWYAGTTFVTAKEAEDDNSLTEGDLKDWGIRVIKGKAAKLADQTARKDLAAYAKKDEDGNYIFDEDGNVQIDLYLKVTDGIEVTFKAPGGIEKYTDTSDEENPVETTKPYEERNLDVHLNNVLEGTESDDPKGEGYTIEKTAESALTSYDVPNPKYKEKKAGTEDDKYEFEGWFDEDTLTAPAATEAPADPTEEPATPTETPADTETPTLYAGPVEYKSENDGGTTGYTESTTYEPFWNTTVIFKNSRPAEEFASEDAAKVDDETYKIRLSYVVDITDDPNNEGQKIDKSRMGSSKIEDEYRAYTVEGTTKTPTKETYAAPETTKALTINVGTEDEPENKEIALVFLGWYEYIGTETTDEAIKTYIKTLQKKSAVDEVTYDTGEGADNTSATLKLFDETTEINDAKVVYAVYVLDYESELQDPKDDDDDDTNNQTPGAIFYETEIWKDKDAEPPVKNEVIPFRELEDPDDDTSHIQYNSTFGTFKAATKTYYMYVPNEIESAAAEFIPASEGASVKIEKKVITTVALTDEEKADTTTYPEGTYTKDVTTWEDAYNTSETNAEGTKTYTVDKEDKEENPGQEFPLEVAKNNSYNTLRVTVTAADGESETVYVFNILRMNKPHLKKEYGNTPVGLIYRDDETFPTIEDKTKAITAFKNSNAKNPSYGTVEDKLLMPKNGQTSRWYSVAAWTSFGTKNYDFDEYAYVIYHGQRFSTLTNVFVNEYGEEKDDVAVNAEFTVRAISKGVPLYDSTTLSSDSTRTQDQLTKVGKYYKTNDVIIRPYVYTITYKYSYTPLGADTPVEDTDTRPLIALTRLGDVYLTEGGHGVNAQDANNLMTSYSNIGVNTKVRNTLFAFRVADVAPGARSVAPTITATEGSTLRSKAQEMESDGFYFYPIIEPQTD